MRCRRPSHSRLSLPAVQRKLDATEALVLLAEEAGLLLIHLALAFVLNHPAVTAAIIGPRTMEHLESQLGALDVRLDDDLLDRIDEIVPLSVGNTVFVADSGAAVKTAPLRSRREAGFRATLASSRNHEGVRMGVFSKLLGKLKLPGSAPVAQAPAPPPASEPRGQEPQQDRGEGEHEPSAGGAS